MIISYKKKECILKSLDYGIKTEKINNSSLLKSLNKALEETFPKMPKDKKIKFSKISPSMLDNGYSIGYRFFYKKLGIYIDIYANQDDNGNKKYPESESDYILFFNPTGFYIDDNDNVFHEDNPKFMEYIDRFLSSLGFSYEILHEYEANENRK